MLEFTPDPERGGVWKRGGDLPGGLVSFCFLLIGFLESPLSLFLDMQDTSVFVPGKQGAQNTKTEKGFIKEYHPIQPSASGKEMPRKGVCPLLDGT